MDADVFAAFKESGDIFDKETAARARKYIYSAGNTVSPDELFRLFRGRDPDIKFMLEKKGLVASENAGINRFGIENESFLRRRFSQSLRPLPEVRGR